MNWLNECINRFSFLLQSCYWCIALLLLCACPIKSLANCDLHLIVNFEEGDFWNQDDVEIFLDGRFVDTLKNGVDADISFLAENNLERHVLVFYIEGKRTESERIELESEVVSVECSLATNSFNFLIF